MASESSSFFDWLTRLAHISSLKKYAKYLFNYSVGVRYLGKSAVFLHTKLPEFTVCINILTDSIITLPSFTCMATTIPYQTECQLYRTHLALVQVVATVTGSKFKIGGDSDVTASETSAIACAFVCDFSRSPLMTGILLFLGGTR